MERIPIILPNLFDTFKVLNFQNGVPNGVPIYPITKIAPLETVTKESLNQRYIPTQMSARHLRSEPSSFGVIYFQSDSFFASY